MVATVNTTKYTLENDLTKTEKKKKARKKQEKRRRRRNHRTTRKVMNEFS